MNQLQRDLLALHAEWRSWRRVGAILGKSGSYARRVARGELRASAEAEALWRQWQGQPVVTCRQCGHQHVCEA